MTEDWVELCCGSAAVTLRLLGGARALPPVSYQGSKRKYSEPILSAFGLRSGEGARRVLLCDAGPWGLVWQQLSADVNLRWYMRDLNALDDSAQRVAFDDLRHRWHRITDPIERAAVWLWLLQRSYGSKGPHAGYVSRRIKDTPGRKQGEWRHPIDAPVDRLRSIAQLHWPETTVHHGDVRDVTPIPGAKVYIDSDYQGTTGYGASLPRDDLLELMRRWDAVGATVVASEAEPLPMPGWHHFDLTNLRSGTPRNWSKQKTEWLTTNRPPVQVLGTQLGLFNTSRTTDMPPYFCTAAAR